MDYRLLGTTGLYVSALGLGCNNFGSRMDAASAAAVVHQALEDGVTFFDTAEAYGNGESEEQLGAALGKRRAEAIIATKFGSAMTPGPGSPGSRYNVLRACGASLRRLQTDYIDVYYLHLPDPKTPVEETLDAMNDLIHQGKVRYIAASNLAGWQVADADHTARRHGYERFAANQVEWSLLSRGVEGDVVPACRHFSVGIVAFQGLASGMLTGKYGRGEPFPSGSRMSLGLPYFNRMVTDDNFDIVDRLTAVAKESGHSLLELAFGWLLSQDDVASVLAGATTPEQVTDNVNASSWRLSRDELESVQDALRGP
jgi:aryl-alcohol dehydrogenase-like predicted oxidoreductase